MNLELEIYLAENYKSKSQIARVLTENWVKKNSYCPHCGAPYLNKFENNKPVADFYCSACKEQFELKSKNAYKIGKNIIDGAYSTMIKRIVSEENPNFFFLTYDKIKWRVTNFLIIPKYYFTPEIIEKRKPLKSTAKRAGWVGCNIKISRIPETGRIFLVKKSHIIPKETVLLKWKKTEFLRHVKIEKKGWIFDVMNCIDAIPNEIFTLQEVYACEKYLKQKYPNNNFIKEKIRQQLQFLRDKGLIEFKGKGVYKKLYK